MTASKLSSSRNTPHLRLTYEGWILRTKISNIKFKWAWVFLFLKKLTNFHSTLWLTNIYSKKTPKHSLGIKDVNRQRGWGKGRLLFRTLTTTNPGHCVSLPCGCERRSIEFPYESTLFFMDAVERKNTQYIVWTRGSSGQRLSGLCAWILLLNFITWCDLEQEKNLCDSGFSSKMGITTVFIL